MPVPRTIHLIPLALALLSAPITAKPASQSVGSAALFSAKGSDVGYAVISKKRDRAVLRISLNGIAPGDHGLHFHTTGACKGDGFSGAGGHLNPGGHQHGMKNPMGSHLGDLPNITADANGFVLTEIPLTGSAKRLIAALFDADGSAIVVHAGPDDNITDPSGNSGGRIACGVFRKN